MKRSNLKIKDMRTYIETDYPIAYSKARKELGPNLVIIEKTEIKVGGFLGFFAQKKIKVTFGVEAGEIKIKKNNIQPENTEIMDLLKKMGYNDNKNKEFLKEEKKEEINTGVYSPYKNRSNGVSLELGLSKKKELLQTVDKSQDSLDDIKEKLKKELSEELKKEIFKEGLNVEKKEEIKKKVERKTSLISERLREAELTNEVIEKIETFLDEKAYIEENYLKGIKEYFYENIDVTGGVEENKFIMLVGPTGVGKTTSCAKIVANKWKDEKDVALVTADTYRLGAVEQLKAYGNIMKIPVEVINKPEDLNFAIEKFKDKDFVVMDTAGRSPKNKEQMAELEEYVKLRGSEIAVYLVLSATSKLSVLFDTIEKFKYTGFKNIIFTKLDETTNIGTLLSVYDKYKIKVSHITTGQRVPDDIEEPTKSRLAEIFIEGLK